MISVAQVGTRKNLMNHTRDMEYFVCLAKRNGSTTTYRAGTTTRFYWGDDPEYTEIDNYVR